MSRDYVEITTTRLYNYNLYMPNPPKEREHWGFLKAISERKNYSAPTFTPVNTDKERTIHPSVEHFGRYFCELFERGDLDDRVFAPDLLARVV